VKFEIEVPDQVVLCRLVTLAHHWGVSPEDAIVMLLSSLPSRDTILQMVAESVRTLRAVPSFLLLLSMSFIDRIVH